MPRSSRSATLAVAAALAACASQPSAPRTCGTSADCPADARCLGASCVANAPPQPAIALPDAPQAHLLLAFDGSASADPDPGDAVATWAWTFLSLTAGCAPPVVAGTQPVAQVRFGCAGRYAVELTVKDQLARSATTIRELDVAPLDGPAFVTVGPDVALDHACTSLPTRCAPTGTVALSASAPAIGTPDLAFAWTVEPPPDRALDAHRRVTFTPSASAPSPTVSIETDGQGISGDWIFRVEARDGAGVIGTAATRVSVSNRPPIVEKAIPIPDHAFAGGQLTAAGEVPFTISDPDGDALLGPTIALHHAGDGEGTFAGGLLPDPSRLAFSVSVPYAAPADGLHLIDGEGLERSVTFEVTDVNGAVTSEVWPIVVGNRPPSLVSAPSAFTVEHRYDETALAYVATAELSAWSDPDGDPLFQAADTGDPRCAALTVADGANPRRATAHCSLAFTGTAAVANFAGVHSVTQTIRDPWAAAAQSSTVAFTIANRAPVIDPAAGDYVVDETCGAPSGCCDGIPGECLQFSYAAPAGTALVPSRWSDPDGDPLALQVPAKDGITPVPPPVCTASECVLSLGLPELQVCGTSRTDLATTLTDGLASASGTLAVVRDCTR